MISNLNAQLLATSVTGRTYRISWSGSADLYYIYLDGVLVGTTAQTWYDLTVGVGQRPLIDVLDDPAAVPAEVFPEGVTLAWYSSGAGTAGYRIDKWIDGDWVEQETVGETWYQTWTSGAVADDTLHTYQSTPLGINGNEGIPLQRSVLMVRRPDAPQVSFDYDALAGTVTISS